MEKEQRNGIKHSSEKEVVSKEKVSSLKRIFVRTEKGQLYSKCEVSK